jgi:hypothetical protein
MVGHLVSIYMQFDVNIRLYEYDVQCFSLPDFVGVRCEELDAHIN